MKQIVTLMAAGAMAVLLTACGEQAPKQPTVKTQDMAAPAQHQPEAAKPGEPAKPAEANPAAAAGATSQE